MSKDDKKEEALGGNFKFRGLKVFGSKENLHHNEKKYRLVYDALEAKYIYCELSFFNKLFDELEWVAHARFVCKEKISQKEICTLEKEIPVLKDKNIVYVREGWGTPQIGWWKPGAYLWEVYLENELVGITPFNIVSGGPVNEGNNPYFDLEEIRLFESDSNGSKREDRNYLNKFNAAKTRYVNVELKIKLLLENPVEFPLELQFNFYNDAGQQKAFMSYYKEIRSLTDTFLIDTGYGADTPGYWFEDKYTLEVIFMDELIAVVPFEIGTEEIPSNDPLNYLKTKKALNSKKVGKSKKLTFEEAKIELDQLIGLNSVKTQINELASYLQFLKIRQGKGLEDTQKINLHSVFVGNPGTGKTTVANRLGKIYQSLDLLPECKVHEVGRADLVGEFIGQTAPKVKKALDQARGGILFIDEAYALTNRGDDNKDFGREVIEVLLKELSDGKGDIAIIFAGYPKEMTNFLNSNPGLNSRLRNVIHFPDYSPDDLMEIAEYTAQKRGVLMGVEARDVMHKKLVEIYRNRNNQFGNARYVNGIIDEAKQNLAIRIMKDHDKIHELPPESLSEILPEDIIRTFPTADKDLDLLPIDDALLNDALTQLHALVGLEDIKREVDEISKLVRYYREIGKDIRKAFSIHTVFTGNPGTGKTTIARLLVQIYKALGILERGQMIEVDRRSLVAGFVGQTAIKTSEKIDEAIGGGLFIDEAYGLSSGGTNDFGREAIETLLKRMEDQRGQFMVIVAGYPEEMKQFIEANPGLMSRFDRQFDFPDYNHTELLSISKLMFSSENLEMESAAEEHLTLYVEKLLNRKHKYFGNARTIRKIVLETIRRQNLRMASIPPEKRSSELIGNITLEDINSFELMESEVEDRQGIGFRN